MFGWLKNIFNNNNSNSEIKKFYTQDAQNNFKKTYKNAVRSYESYCKQKDDIEQSKQQGLNVSAEEESWLNELHDMYMQNIYEICQPLERYFMYLNEGKHLEKDGAVIFYLQHQAYIGALVDRDIKNGIDENNTNLLKYISDDNPYMTFVKNFNFVVSEDTVKYIQNQMLNGNIDPKDERLYNADLYSSRIFAMNKKRIDETFNIPQEEQNDADNEDKNEVKDDNSGFNYDDDPLGLDEILGLDKTKKKKQNKDDE